MLLNCTDLPLHADTIIVVFERWCALTWTGTVHYHWIYDHFMRGHYHVDYLHNNIQHIRSGEPRMQKLKSNLMRTHRSLKVLPLKPGVGQCIGMHATLTARDFFLANFYPSDPFTCIFSKPLPRFFLR